MFEDIVSTCCVCAAEALICADIEGELEKLTDPPVDEATVACVLAVLDVPPDATVLPVE
tara:strand:- start:37 stop:213 length:177 start_codon:yes stop_codon:yes gene_type:complete